MSTRSLNDILNDIRTANTNGTILTVAKEGSLNFLLSSQPNPLTH